MQIWVKPNPNYNSYRYFHNSSWTVLFPIPPLTDAFLSSTASLISASEIKSWVNTFTIWKRLRPIKLCSSVRYNKLLRITYMFWFYKRIANQMEMIKKKQRIKTEAGKRHNNRGNEQMEEILCRSWIRIEKKTMVLFCSYWNSLVALQTP